LTGSEEEKGLGPVFGTSPSILRGLLYPNTHYRNRRSLQEHFSNVNSSLQYTVFRTHV